jgi:predicted site-specific integrase-resolvase
MLYTIDTEKELPPAQYAKRIGVDVHVVSNWMKRGQINYRRIEELNLTLVEVGSEVGRVRERRNRIIDTILKD